MRKKTLFLLAIFGFAHVEDFVCLIAVVVDAWIGCDI